MISVELKGRDPKIAWEILGIYRDPRGHAGVRKMQTRLYIWDVI
jgi:hypothetical protein